MRTAHPLNQPVAIIGMAARYPGSEDLAGFWRTIESGRVEAGEVPRDRWDIERFYDANPKAWDKTYSRTLAHLDDIRSFAPEFFGITPKRARLMDPQQRLILDCARAAIEDAGYAVRELPRASTGVYVGVSVSEHKDLVTSRLHARQWWNESLDHVPHLQAHTMVGQMLNMNAANISHAFDFGGPSFAVDTACSSALVAMHEAALHLRMGVADAAVVGGVYLNLDPANFVAFSRIGALSRAGRCRPFDRAADGFVMGEGAGVVVLKRLADALRDGDRVWAVVRGIAVNNDARSLGPMTPNARGQAEVIRRAWADAGESPRKASLVEAHGTATEAGDASESEAMATVFDGAECALGAVKANIGHALAASGMASVIKTALALDRETLPPLAGFEAQNDTLRLGGFQLPREARPWRGQSRWAGVSSFGFGGANAHVVLEDGPRAPRKSFPSAEVTRWPFVFSAPNEILLRSYLERVAPCAAPLHDLSWTVCMTRPAQAVSARFTAASRQEFRQRLQSAIAGALHADASFPTDLDAFFEGRAGRPVELPPSPLEAREMRPVAEAAAPEEDRGAAEEILNAIAHAGAYSREHVTRDRRLRSDLGLDSLAAVDLEARLVEAYPALADRAGSLWEQKDPTVGEFVDAVIKMIGGSSPAATVESAPVEQVLRLQPQDHPWLRDHRVEGVCVVPFAQAIEWCRTAALAAGASGTLTGIERKHGIRVAESGTYVWISTRADDSGVAIEISSSPARDGGRVTGYTARAPFAEPEIAALGPAGQLVEGLLSVDEFYGRHAFHGPALQVIAATPSRNDHAVRGLVRSAGSGPIDVAALDGALQVAAWWAVGTHGRLALPLAVESFRLLKPMAAGVLRCEGRLSADRDDLLAGDFDLFDSQGDLVAQARGLKARLRESQAAIEDAQFRIEQFPEVVALRKRMADALRGGLPIPYFVPHGGVARDTSIVDGREMISFSTYNYLGLSGNAAVTEAAVEATRRYGTSVSASRVAAGERPIHRQLEQGIARFLGCEDAIVFVGGHATNVATIGHIVGPGDLILCDALSHDSILGGAKLSGARFRVFPHNDADALDRILTELRPKARRVLIAVEGVYSMDGDIAPLDRLVALRNKHRALLLVDEAHSLGVLGATGRGVGEHFGVARASVDLWMGTLSKSLASCGGYIAGSAALVEYLKFTVPGFVYSVGLSPANAGAALAAIEEMDAHPELVAALRDRADLFRELCRERGIDIGASAGSAVVPSIVGGSEDCLVVAELLKARGINVHPIVYPAVAEDSARLRFFISALHSEEQIRYTVACLHEELAARGAGLLRSAAA